MVAKRLLDLVDTAAAVDSSDPREVERTEDGIDLFKAGAGFKIIRRFAPACSDPGKADGDRRIEEKGEVRSRGKGICRQQLFNRKAVQALVGDGREKVAVTEDDLSMFKSRDNTAFEVISAVEKKEFKLFFCRQLSARVEVFTQAAAMGTVTGFTGGENRMPEIFEPVAKLAQLTALAGTVSAFKDDKETSFLRDFSHTSTSAFCFPGYTGAG